MCHLILLLPLLTLPLFWVVPLSVAVPAYGAVLIVSGGVYYLAVRAMRRPVQTGREALLNSKGVIVGMDGRISVRCHGELWTAECAEEVEAGDIVEIIGVEGLKLRVRPLDDSGMALPAGERM